MKTLNLWGIAVLSATAAFGCKGSGSGGPSTSEDFCMQYATEICQIAVPCDISPSDCMTYQQGQCNQAAALAISDGKRVYAPGNAGDCINKVKAAYGSSNPITPSTLASIDLACNYVFQGTGKQLTDMCNTQFDCAGTTNGTIICDADQKLCATSTSIGNGQQCNGVGDVCAQDNYCATNNAGVQICTADATSSDSCATVPCDHNSYCANGTCAALLAAGAPCSSDRECSAAAPYCALFNSPPDCDVGLRFASGSPSCMCVGLGQGCPAGITGSGGSGGGSGGASGSGGAAGGSATGSGGAGGAGGTLGLGGTLGAGGILGGGGIGGATLD